MNQFDLDRLLQEGRVPDRSDDYWNGFPDSVIRRLRMERISPAPHEFWRLATGSAIAAVCGLALGFSIWHRTAASSDRYKPLWDGRVVQELMAQYSGRLQAIIQDENGLHTQLSEASDVSESDPIWLEIRDGADHRVIVTFSGQRIRCGGKNVIVLSDVGGQIMLVGDGFFWSPQVAAGLADKVQIRAEQFTGKRTASKPPSSL
jgi:hypothetical protein